MKLATIMQHLNIMYPPKTAESWDNVGLLLGDPNSDIKNILITLDITDEVVNEAIEKKIDLIITHHPIFFNKVSNLVSNAQNNKIINLIKHDIAVFSLHTNVDVGVDGMNDWLANKLGLSNIHELCSEYQINIYKLSVLVLKEELEHLKEIILPFALNKSALNSSSEQLFEHTITTIKVVNDEGTFLKAEACILEDDIDSVRKLLINSSINNFEFAKISNPSLNLGIGRIGEIETVDANQFANDLVTLFNYPVRYSGASTKKIHKVCVVGGSGSEYIKQAVLKGCDAIITGDVKYHDAQLAEDLGIVIYDIGHYAESIFKTKMAEILTHITDCNVVETSINTDPYTYV